MKEGYIRINRKHNDSLIAGKEQVPNRYLTGSRQPVSSWVTAIEKEEKEKECLSVSSTDVSDTDRQPRLPPGADSDFKYARKAFISFVISGRWMQTTLTVSAGRIGIIFISPYGSTP